MFLFCPPFAVCTNSLLIVTTTFMALWHIISTRSFGLLIIYIRIFDIYKILYHLLSTFSLFLISIISITLPRSFSFIILQPGNTLSTTPNILYLLKRYQDKAYYRFCRCLFAALKITLSFLGKNLL